MLNLPKASEYGHRVPKESLYSHLNPDSKLKQNFVDQIKTIIWQNKLAPATINIPAGPNVQEIEVFAINLKGENFDETILKFIDSQIPYFLVHVLCYGEKYKIVVGYKTGLKTGNYKVEAYYSTSWLDKDQAVLEIEGLNLDEVYNNFIRQVGKEQLVTNSLDEDFSTTVERTKAIKKLDAIADKLRNQQYRENQPKKQFEIHEKLLQIEHKLEALRHGKA